MGHLERALEWLRPMILGSDIWDYCVVWKLGHDPSRFIEWVDCCCNGGGNQEVGIKKKRKETIPVCKDGSMAHPVSTKSCEALARLPSFMSIYSGIHGEVVISSQPRWISIAEISDSKPSNDQEFVGTRVLIPVVGGLIELFSPKLIAENESIIEHILAQFSSSEIETMSNSTITYDGSYADPLSTNSLSSLNPLHILPLTQSLTQLGQCSDSTFGGSSTGSIPSEERPSPDSTPSSVSQGVALSLQNCCPRDYIVKDETNRGQRAEKKQCKSKNLLTERNRRKRINDGMLNLRSLVPKITKMHKAATLSDAVDYINQLQDEKRKLLHELEDCNKSSTYELVASGFEREIVERRDMLHLNKRRVTSSLTKCSKFQVEVNELGTGRYLLRVVCQQSPAAFTILLEALASLGVLVEDINATVCDGKMSTNIMVQTNQKEIQVKDLKESLMQLND